MCRRESGTPFERVDYPLRCTACLCYLLLAGVISAIVIASLSFHKIDESEACILTNTYRGTTDFEPITSAGRVAASPWHELVCYPTTIQTFLFRQGLGGLSRPITVRASDGLEIQLELEVDFIVSPRDVGRLIQRFDKVAFPVAQRIVRSEVRDATSSFETTQFLTGDRVLVTAAILNQTAAGLSEHYMTALRVNLLHITVPSDFRTRFLTVEAINLDVREEREFLPIRQATVDRENQTRVVDLLAARDAQTIAAERDVDAARLAQLGAVVAETTRQLERTTIEETTRVTELTNAAAAVDGAIAEAKVNVSAARLDAERRVLASERNREIVLANAKRRVAEEIARAEALVAAAETELQTTVINQATRLLLASEAAKRAVVEAAGFAAAITEQGTAEAAVTKEAIAAELFYMATAVSGGWTERQASAASFYRALAGDVLTNATAFLDYTKQPLSYAELVTADVSPSGVTTVGSVQA